MLREAGYDVAEAEDGQEAWELFSAAASSEPFALDVNDVEMPRMDGFALAGKLQETAPDVPIIALTDLADSERIARLRGLGVREFIEKSPRVSGLVECAARLIAEDPSGRNETLHDTTET